MANLVIVCYFSVMFYSLSKLPFWKPTDFDIEIERVRMGMWLRRDTDWEKCFPEIAADNEYWSTGLPLGNTSAQTEEVR